MTYTEERERDRKRGGPGLGERWREGAEKPLRWEWGKGVRGEGEKYGSETERDGERGGWQRKH